MTNSPTWPTLIVLMAFGDGEEDVLAGMLHTRDVVEIDADGAEADCAGRRGTVTPHPVLGQVCVTEATMRVQRRGDLARVEGSDGTRQMIFGADTVWVWDDADAELPTTYPRARSSFAWAGTELLQRPPLSRWDGTDFTTLTGPIEASALLGRPAWSFELAPPGHKPYPLQMVVDAETGLVLRQANRDFGSVTEWTELETGVELPGELFVWAGPAKPPPDRQAAHERDMAQRRGWLSSRGIDDIWFRLAPKLMLNEWDDASGAFHASFDGHQFGSLARRAVSEQEWPAVDCARFPFAYRWRDEVWEWYLGTTIEVAEDDLRALRDRVAGTR